MPRKKATVPRRLRGGEKRDHCVSVRLNDAELVRLNRERGAYLRGEWLRWAWLKTTPRQAAPEINRAAWAELSHVCGNLNQIAYRANAAGSLSKKDQEKLFPLLDEVKSCVQLLRNDLLGIDQENEDDEGDAEDS
jgi:hypothetical protein